MNLSWKLGHEPASWVGLMKPSTDLFQKILGGPDEAFWILPLISNDLRMIGLVSPIWLVWLTIIIISSRHR